MSFFIWHFATLSHAHRLPRHQNEKLHELAVFVMAAGAFLFAEASSCHAETKVKIIINLWKLFYCF